MSPSGRAALELTDGEIADLLPLAAAGNTDAQDRLFQLLLPRLRQMAAARMAREKAGHTLSPTGLVNEAFLRLASQHKLPAENIAQFLGVFGLTMRRVLVDHWKKKNAVRAGRGWERVPFDRAFSVPGNEENELLAVHACLERLERERPRQAKVVELRFFGGLSNREVAEHLGTSLSTVEADWRFARAWLRRELEAR
jgi:RNA polymerase sigma factor (TIGR02999 family)